MFLSCPAVISWTEKATLTTWFLEDVPILFLIINANLRLPHSRKRDREPWVLFLYLTGKICSWKPRREFMQIISQYAYLVTSVWTFLTLFFFCLYLKHYFKCEELKTARRFFVLCASDMRCTWQGGDCLEIIFWLVESLTDCLGISDYASGELWDYRRV